MLTVWKKAIHELLKGILEKFSTNNIHNNSKSKVKRNITYLPHTHRSSVTLQTVYVELNTN